MQQHYDDVVRSKDGLRQRDRRRRDRTAPQECLSTRLKAQRDFAEAVERGFQVLDDFGGDLVRRRQQVGIVERVVLSQKMSRLILSRATSSALGKRRKWSVSARSCRRP